MKTDHFVLPRLGTAEFRCRLDDWDATLLLAADIQTVLADAYSVNTNNGRLTAVAAQLVLTPADVIHALRAWDGDATGYNFSHVYPNRTSVFTELGKRYRVEYQLVPADAAEQIIVLAFEFTIN